MPKITQQTVPGTMPAQHKPAQSMSRQPVPRYLEIQRDLQEKIASGDWPPGCRVPPEHELQERYCCSRMTVNKALSALSGAGLILRKRRSGSFVATPKSQETVLEIHDIKAEILSSGRGYKFEILSRQQRPMTAEDSSLLGVERGGLVLALLVRHMADDRPFVVEERLLNLAIVPTAADEPFTVSPPGTWLLELVPWTAAEHVIRADMASMVMARHLGLGARSACLIIERRTWQGGATITFVRLTYPGASHTLTSRFSPGERM